MIDLEVLYAILVQIARTHRQITHAELSQLYFERTQERHELPGTWDEPLAELTRNLCEGGLPPLSVVVVLPETNEPGVLFWGCSPNVPQRPKNSMQRIATFGSLLREVFVAKWPETLPAETPA